MTRKLSAIFAAVLCLCMLTAATAETISFDGSVTVKDTYEVYAPIGGTVDSVPFSAGEAVKAEDVLISLKTTKVYATEDGTVTGLFGEPGDSAETLTSRYGAVMYIEGTKKYTISCSTENAYNSTENKYVHVGETVYMTSRSDSSHKGQGTITKVSGTDYTVEVSSGSFEIGESCNVYRKSTRTESSRVGRGTVARVDPTAVTGTGSIVAFAVKDGDTVKRGQLLFETLTGEFDGLYMSGKDIMAGVDGVIGSISATKGSAIQKDAVVAVIYPTGSMRIEGSVAETDLSNIHVGDAVEIEMNWNSDNDELVKGTVTMISAVGTSSGDNASYTVYIDFEADENTRYGMTCVINTVEDKSEEPEEEEAEEAEEAEETEEAAEQPSGEFPQNGEFPQGEMPEGFTPPTQGN